MRLRQSSVVVHRRDLVLDAVAARERIARQQNQQNPGEAHQCASPAECTEPAGCASYHRKYFRYWWISFSERFWFGIGTPLNSLSSAFAWSSLASISSGDLSQCSIHSPLRRLVTPARSGP